MTVLNLFLLRSHDHDLLADLFFSLAYLDTGYYLFLPALICTIIPLIAGFVTVDFRLDDRHNAIETKEQNMLSADETTEEAIKQRVAEAEEKARQQARSAH